MHRMRTGAALLVGSALLLSACGGGSSNGNPSSAAPGGSSTAPTTSSSAPVSSAPADEKVTLTWWHNATADPLKSYFQKVADAYTAAHPNVTFKIEPVQNETIQTKITVALQSNNPPDIFQQWGGGDLATQVKTGKVQDITAASGDTIKAIGGQGAGWTVDGKQYGLPYSVRHRRLLVPARPVHQGRHQRAPDHDGRAGRPTSASSRPRASRPIAVGGKDKWPDAFYWGYFAVRDCSQETHPGSHQEHRLQ